MSSARSRASRNTATSSSTGRSAAATMTAWFSRAVCDMLDRNPTISMADLRMTLQKTWSSPTMAANCADEVKYRVVDDVASLPSGAAKGEQVAGQSIRDLVTVNGVRVTVEDGTWGLVRASSNKPELVVVVESPVSETAHARHVQGGRRGAAHSPGGRRIESNDLSANVALAQAACWRRRCGCLRSDCSKSSSRSALILGETAPLRLMNTVGAILSSGGNGCTLSSFTPGRSAARSAGPMKFPCRRLRNRASHCRTTFR